MSGFSVTVIIINRSIVTVMRTNSGLACKAKYSNTLKYTQIIIVFIIVIANEN